MESSFIAVAGSQRVDEESQIVYPVMSLIQGEYRISIKNLIDDLYATKNRPELYTKVMEVVKEANITKEYVFQTALFEKIPQWVEYLLKQGISTEIIKQYNEDIIHLLCGGQEFLEKIKRLIEVVKLGVSSTELKELKSILINEEQIKEIIQREISDGTSSRYQREHTN